MRPAARRCLNVCEVRLHDGNGHTFTLVNSNWWSYDL